MLPTIFEEAIHAACGDSVSIRNLTLPWPDDPLISQSSEPELQGISEFVGSVERVTEHVGNAHALITHVAPLTRSIFAAKPMLKFVAVTRGGPVNVDLTAADDSGVTVVNAPGRNASSVAEFTIAAILTQIKNIIKGHEALRTGRFRGDLYRADKAGGELSEMSVGIIGYGAIGSRVVKHLQTFGSTILVNDPKASLDEADIAYGVRKLTLNALLREADIVSLHCRLTPQTRNLMNRDAFQAMKRGTVLINTARGELVDCHALETVLRNGHLQSAMLDTFDPEPPPAEWPLLKLPNVTVTPHIAGATLKTVRVSAEMAAEELRRWLAGEPPLHPCSSAAR